MLASVIKNAVLIILIVLILHFLLRNALQDRPGTSGVPSPAPALSLHKGASASHSIPKEEPAPVAERFSTEPSNPVMPAPSGSFHAHVNGGCGAGAEAGRPEAVDELYQFVYEKKRELPVEAAAPPAPIAAPITPADAPSSLASQRVVIKEYANEKTMNGGALFDGLNAFDDEFAPYETLEKN